jgi:hypothetical protein
VRPEIAEPVTVLAFPESGAVLDRLLSCNRSNLLAKRNGDFG